MIPLTRDFAMSHVQKNEINFFVSFIRDRIIIITNSYSFVGCKSCVNAIVLLANA